MVNVLIVGATGYIGQALSQSLVRSGDHRVFGLARTPEKARALESQEVIPISGSISDNDKLLKAINTNHINLVVDVASAMQESYDLLALLRKIGADRLDTASKAGLRVQKLGFIYCSGTWVYGSSPDPVNELLPLDVLGAQHKPSPLISWRPQLEQAVIAAADVLDTMVIRPALVYGRSSAIWSKYFDPLYVAVQNGAASVSLPAVLRSQPALIHVDDVASAFHVAIDKLPLISGTGVYPLFDLLTSQENMKDILTSAAKEFGFKGTVELTDPGDDLFAKAMCTSTNTSSGRARQILGWEPKRYGFVQGMSVFAKAWVASKQ